MKFTCDSCGAAYMISDDKVGPSGVKVRCKKCGNVVTVRRAEAPPVVAPAPAPAPAAPVGLDDELGNAFDHAFGDPPQAPAAAAPEAPAAPAAPADLPATEWYVAIGEAQVGPLPLTEVKKKWEAGDVGPDSLVWRPGMADWGPLSGVSDLAAYLAPVPQPRKPAALAPAAVVEAPAPAARPTSRPSMASVAPGAAAAVQAAPSAAGGDEVTWKPAGASALAALVSEEIESRQAPAVSAAPKAPANRSLIDQLPDGGGVDPTGAIPLTIRGMERTDEKPIKRSSVARGAEEARHRRTVRTALVGVVGALVLVGGGAGAAWWFLGRPEPLPARPPLVAQAPAPAPVPVPPPPAPAVAPPAGTPATPAADPAAGPAAGAGAGLAAAATRPAEAATAVPPPEPARPVPPRPEPAVAAAPVAKKPAVAAPRPAVKPPAKPAAKQAVAAAEPPAAEKPAAKKKDSLLDFEGGEDDLTAALGGSGGRTVYVPPKPGGTTAPDRLSDAQITESVRLHVDALRRCAAEQQAREPGVKGTLKMAWTIQADGAPRDVRSLTPDLAQGQFAQCISGVVRGIRFPRIADPKGQAVTFPFGF